MRESLTGLLMVVCLVARKAVELVNVKVELMAGGMVVLSDSWRVVMMVVLKAETSVKLLAELKVVGLVDLTVELLEMLTVVLTDNP